jgi:hypothetical protein
LVVSSIQEASALRSRGFGNVHVIRPGIDQSQINVQPPKEPDTEFVLLAGSAPWTSIIQDKGFDLLLRAADSTSADKTHISLRLHYISNGRIGCNHWAGR